LGEYHPMLRHFFECALEEGFTCLRRALFGVVRSLTYGSPKMHTEPGGKVRRWSVGHDAPYPARAVARPGRRFRVPGGRGA
jgi:hypothetical protein